MSERVATVSIEVPFHDVDALRVVWHGHYLKYFEIARTKLFRDVGIEAADLEARGVAFVVIESRCRHTRPSRIGDVLTVEARFLPRPDRLTIVYRARIEANGTVVARGRTDLAAIDLRSGSMIDVPADILTSAHG